MHFLNQFPFSYPGDVALSPQVQLLGIQGLSWMQHGQVTPAQVSEEIEKLLGRKWDKRRWSQGKKRKAGWLLQTQGQKRKNTGTERCKIWREVGKGDKGVTNSRDGSSVPLSFGLSQQQRWLCSIQLLMGQESLTTKTKEIFEIHQSLLGKKKKKLLMGKNVGTRDNSQKSVL